MLTIAIILKLLQRSVKRYASSDKGFKKNQEKWQQKKKKKKEEEEEEEKTDACTAPRWKVARYVLMTRTLIKDSWLTNWLAVFFSFLSV